MMDSVQKSQVIKDGLRRGFQDGTSKMAQRRCYGYDIGLNGQLTINFDEAAVVRWIFERYLHGDSLGKIASALEVKSILSPTGKTKWNREALNKLLSNEKYTGHVLLQKTVSTETTQIRNDGLMDRTFTPIPTKPSFLTNHSKLPKKKRCGAPSARGENPLCKCFSNP